MHDLDAEKGLVITISKRGLTKLQGMDADELRPYLSSLQMKMQPAVTTGSYTLAKEKK